MRLGFQKVKDTRKADFITLTLVIKNSTSSATPAGRAKPIK